MKSFKLFAESTLSYILKNPGKKLPMELDPNRPFDPDPPKKKPSVVPGKHGSGPSLAKHLAKMAMKKQIDKKQGVAEGAKWRKHPDAYDVDDEGNKTPRNPNSPKFGYDPLQRRADTANDAKTPRGKTAALKTSLKMAKGQKGVAEGLDKLKLDEAGPFSYGYKPPRKGSVAYNAMMKRKEQEKNKPPIEPKDQMVGTAKVVREDDEVEAAMKRRDENRKKMKFADAEAIYSKEFEGIMKRRGYGKDNPIPLRLSDKDMED